MAQKRIASGSGDPEDVETIIDVDHEDVTKLANDIESEESAITQEFDADSRDVTWNIKVYRSVEGKSTMSYLFTCTPADFPIIDKLRDNYGTGTYKARVYKNGKLYRSLPYRVESPRIPTVPQTPSNNAEMQAVIHALNQQQQLLAQLINKQNSPPQTDPIDSIVKLATAMKAVMPSPIQAAAPPDPTAMMTMFFKAMEMGRDMAGGGEGSNFIDLARDAVKAIGPTLARAAAQGTPALPSAPKAPQQISAPTPTPVATPEPPSSPPSQPEGNNVSQFPPHIENILKAQLPGLINKAARGSDPGLYAEFIVDNVPLEMIQQHLIDENLIEKLSLIDARVLQYRNWFAELRNNLHAILTEPNSTDDTSEHANNAELAADGIDGTTGRGTGS